MGLHKLTAGDGYTYLTRQVAAHDTTEKGHSSLGDYYDEQGESPGRWRGTGLTGLDIAAGERVSTEQMKALFGEGRHPNAQLLEAAVVKTGGSAPAAHAAGALGRPFNIYDASSTFNVQVARQFTTYNTDRGLSWNAAIPGGERSLIRTAVASRMFHEAHDRPPLNDRELAGFVARASRQATKAVAGYDLTFSPVKSVSTLWALAAPEVADQIRVAHHRAVEDALGWLEREAAFTRVGHAGARQVDVQGLVAAAFTHRDSRAGDPDLHTHLAVSNKVQTRDGRWLALDGRVLHQATVAASERYNTRLEAELVARLGVRFVDRPERSGKRPVREIAGINPLLSHWWSTRRRDIDARRSELAATFQSQHGRPPTPVEAIALAQQATLETRNMKHPTRSEAEQRATWRAQADAVLGGPVEVDAMITQALGHPIASPHATAAWTEQAARSVLSMLERSRATWQVWHVRAEAERQARAASIGLRDLDQVVNRITNQALAHAVRLGTPDPIREPDALRRADGHSVYDVHGSARYTSANVLDAEQRLLAGARSTGGHSISEVRVQIALAHQATSGIELNDAQAAMVRDLATSGSRLQLALAPAGTGKTTTMRVLARAWTDAGGHVLGLAPSAQAAHELGQVLTGHTDTLTKLTHTLTRLPRDRWEGWIEQIGPRTLVIIDEAGQAGTAELAAALDYVTSRGGSVRLIGDDQQLASVGAGGILRDIQHTVGAVSLSEIRRFHDHAEAAATLAIRAGDPSALGFYADNNRIHVGDLGAVTDQAYNAWCADRRAGLDTILLAPTRELVTHLNSRARADRIQQSSSGHDPAQVRLVDGTHASAGDAIVTRRNDRQLLTSSSNWVKNGDRWTVRALHRDGSISAHQARPQRSTPRSVLLPADYVKEHVQLGYACTVHAAQGMTTDTAHAVIAGDEVRQLLYVALSRGRQANHLYLANAHDGDPHSLIRPETLIPPTAIDLLATILQRDGSQHSATTTRRDLHSPATLLRQAAARYLDALTFAAEHTLGTATLTTLDHQLETLWPGLTSAPAYPTLRGHLALRALHGADPVQRAIDAAETGELTSAADPAAVLDWRISNAIEDGPLPWLSGLPHDLRSHPDWGPYLQARGTHVRLLAQQVRAEATGWSPTACPDWAARLTSTEAADLRADLAVWRATYDVRDTDHRPTGPHQQSPEAASEQRRLNRRVRRAGGTHSEQHRYQPWSELLPSSVPVDPLFPRLIEHLDALDRAGLRVRDLVEEALGQTRPLPDENPADALWWRLVRRLGPAALKASGGTRDALRASWTAALTSHLGQDAQRVMADSAWPALVAAIHARPVEWTAEQLLESALHGPSIPADELCTALVWRIATLTDEPHEPEDRQDPTEPTDAISLPEEPAVQSAVPGGRRHRDLTTAPSPKAAETSVARIVQLNRAALQYYSDLLPRSWAPAYLLERLGTDLSDEPRFTIGYAPPGPTSLIRHLTAHGASPTELLDAGLAKRNPRGQLTDTFRDRLIFPIHHDQEMVGFIARRNPTKDDTNYGGPKYLNTRATAAFTKGHELFGLSETSEALGTAATPVIVEGPLDAIAITIAAQGEAVGIAPLGTAFTPHQAARLKPYFHRDPARIVIATDPDPAGWIAAQRAFWRLAQLNADPQHLLLPDGIDPAEQLRQGGSNAVTTALGNTQPFAQSILDTLLSTQENDAHPPATRLRLVHDIAQIIGALPPEQWPRHIERVTQRLHLPHGMLHLETLHAGQEWTAEPARQAEARIAEMNHQDQPPPGVTQAVHPAALGNSPAISPPAVQQGPAIERPNQPHYDASRGYPPQVRR